MKILFLLILTLILSFAFTFLFRIISWRFKILDYPNNNKMHRKPTALLGGAAIYLSFMLAVLFTIKEFDIMYKAMFIGSSIIFISGLIDDIMPFSSLKRLFIQSVAAIILICSGAYFTFLPNFIIGRTTEFILTFLWIVGITNTFNYLDGLNGLASGVGIINAIFFFIFASITGQTQLGYILVIFIGACAGFFIQNFFKGKIFMGSCGSTWIGFTLASLAVIGNWAADNPVDLVIPLLIFGVPIFDMISTTISRILDKKTKNVVELLNYRGKDHFHHRLSQAGLGNKGAVFFIFLVCVLLGFNALLLGFSREFINVIIILGNSILFFVLISLLMMTPSAENNRS